MVNRNKMFSFKIKRQAKNVFPSDVERTVGRKKLVYICKIFQVYLLTLTGSYSIIWLTSPSDQLELCLKSSLICTACKYYLLNAKIHLRNSW